MIGRLALFLGCLARTVAGLASSVGGASHPAVVRAMRLMEAAPERPWTLAELADELHLTRGYLVRQFKAPMAYLSRFRVEMAAAMLLHDDLSITQIGVAVGWADANYVARRFKAHYGMSASAYRAHFSHNSLRLRTFAAIA